MYVAGARSRILTKYRTSSGRRARQQTGALSIKLPAGFRNELSEHNVELQQSEPCWGGGGGLLSDEGDSIGQNIQKTAN